MCTYGFFFILRPRLIASHLLVILKYPEPRALLLNILLTVVWTTQSGTRYGAQYLGPNLVVKHTSIKFNFCHKLNLVFIPLTRHRIRPNPFFKERLKKSWFLSQRWRFKNLFVIGIRSGWGGWGRGTRWRVRWPGPWRSPRQRDSIDQTNEVSHLGRHRGALLWL